MSEGCAGDFRKQVLVPWCTLHVRPASECALAQAQRERDHWQAETAHVRQHVAMVQERLQQAQAALAAIREALPFSRDWAVEHARDDHFVDLDHKDELMLAEFVLAVHDALQAGPG